MAWTACLVSSAKSAFKLPFKATGLEGKPGEDYDDGYCGSEDSQDESVIDGNLNGYGGNDAGQQQKKKKCRSPYGSGVRVQCVYPRNI